MAKKEWTSKATALIYAARKSISMARKHIRDLEVELKGRPAHIGCGSTEVLEETPKELTKAKKQLENFYRTYFG